MNSSKSPSQPQTDFRYPMTYNLTMSVLCAETYMEVGGGGGRGYHAILISEPLNGNHCLSPLSVGTGANLTVDLHIVT